MNGQNNDIPEGFKMTELGTLPDEWKVVPICDAAFVTSGGSAPQGDHYFGGNNPFVRVQHIEQDLDRITGWNLITDQAVQDCGLRLYPKGTIVFPKSGASIYLEKRAVLPIDAYIVSHLCALTPKNEIVDNSFLFQALRNIRLAELKADGYPTLNLSEIKVRMVPLPPLSEQKAIARVLSVIHNAVETQDKIITAAKELKKSIMRYLFTYGTVPVPEAENVPLKETEIGPMPEHWETIKVGDVVITTQYGLSLRGEQSGKYPILRMSNLGDGRVHDSDLQYVNLEVKDFEKFRVKKRDILFNRTNSYELVGKTALFDLEGDFVFASYLVKVVPNLTRLIPEYLNYYLNCKQVQNRLRMLATRGVSQSNINATKLRGFMIPLATATEQQEIARMLSSVDKKIEGEENRKAALKTLFKTTLHHLMTGKVRVKDMEATVS
ncbi:Type I restriction-modification system, specificity subunit S [Dehalococcoides mccartyi]|uniref:restriction endonuclease subunit S n=1 Tax=Dehalococcoides mccartyi TaxID=61435 RepID=UPI000CDED6C7|nr:restriction endonuclease subunit S [Dehalococcoides mccartyi]POZ58441.1 Type I restriction-modification system, specificity subunit S [Dehalococcoides mccartyi]